MVQVKVDWNKIHSYSRFHFANQIKDNELLIQIDKAHILLCFTTIYLVFWG